MIFNIFLIFLSSLNAQIITLIDHQSRIPIENVNVFVNNNGTTTNSQGLCNIDIFKKNDKITFSAIGYETVKLKFKEIPEVLYLKRESIPMELVNVFGNGKSSKKRYSRLEKNVRKVYPYAKKISEMLVDYSSIIDTLDEYSGIIKYQRKRKIFSKIENDLISQHGYSIKKLKKRQGRILIRLIDRETSRTSFEIIKDFRNIFSASFWQFTARLFGHNLHSVYNKDIGEDRIIEHIINRIDNEKVNK